MEGKQQRGTSSVRTVRSVLAVQLPETAWDAMKTWRGHCKKTCFPACHQGIFMVICAEGPGVLKQGAHCWHPISKKGEGMQSFPGELGLTAREALALLPWLVRYLTGGDT